ncbi:MAG: ribonuclease III [Sinomicrobium sp.]|nr:ribonuclease III [Sinomicrobium sp.]
MSFVRKILNSRSENDGNFFLSFLEKMLGFKPKDTTIYYKAFIHRSLNKRDKEGNPISYERLEFLGDVMLSAVISEYLFQEVPSGDEGYLTKMRSKIVSREHLNELGKDLNLIKFVQSNIPRENFSDNIHGNVFEALTGAIFLDKGFEYCRKFIRKRVVEPYVDIERLEGKIISYKSLLIEWCQREKKSFRFQVYEDDGNDEIKHFAVKFYIDNEVIAKARETSKKRAEERAAKRAYFSLQKEIALR